MARARFSLKSRVVLSSIVFSLLAKGDCGCLLAHAARAAEAALPALFTPVTGLSHVCAANRPIRPGDRAGGKLRATASGLARSAAFTVAACPIAARRCRRPATS